AMIVVAIEGRLNVFYQVFQFGSF
ncbi:hypothetical protein D030_1608B, partial [Vibrio parahaemolyticus AQ3810]